MKQTTKTTEVLEYVLAAFLLIGGLQTIAGGLIYDQPLDPALIVVFGLCFVVGASLSIFGKVRGIIRWHYWGLMLMVVSLMFGFVGEIVTEPDDFMIWIDSGLLFLFAAYLRIKRPLEEKRWRKRQDTLMSSTGSPVEPS